MSLSKNTTKLNVPCLSNSEQLISHWYPYQGRISDQANGVCEECETLKNFEEILRVLLLRILMLS